MTATRIVLLLASSLLIHAGSATAQTDDCRAQLKRQDEQCQLLAEKLATACPSGTNIKETAQCREISSQIANTCTRKPCAPPRKGKRSKSKGMGGMSGMGERSKPAKQ